MDAIFKRVSVRTYSDEPVSRDEIEQLLRAAMAAPSAMNQQPWEFFVTSDHAILETLSNSVPYWRATAKAAWAIGVCMRRDGLPCPEFVQQDMGACVENLLLEAAELGLGALWMGAYPHEDRMQTIADAFGVPAHLSPFALVAVGRPAAQTTPSGASRFDPERIHWGD